MFHFEFEVVLSSLLNEFVSFVEKGDSVFVMERDRVDGGLEGTALPFLLQTLRQLEFYPALCCLMAFEESVFYFGGTAGPSELLLGDSLRTIEDVRLVVLS